MVIPSIFSNGSFYRVNLPEDDYHKTSNFKYSGMRITAIDWYKHCCAKTFCLSNTQKNNKDTSSIALIFNSKQCQYSSIGNLYSAPQLLIVFLVFTYLGKSPP